MSKVKLIVAVNNNGTIGDKGNIPWHSKADMSHFKQTTSGHTVVMGRKTFDSLHCMPLVNRFNIVLTQNITEEDISRQVYYYPNTLKFFSSLKNALLLAPHGDIFIIGGQQLYQEAMRLNVVDEVILSVIDDDTVGDTSLNISLCEFDCVATTYRDKVDDDKLKCIRYFRRKTI